MSTARAAAFAYTMMGLSVAPRFRGDDRWATPNARRWRSERPPIDLLEQWWPESNPDRYDVKVMTGRRWNLTVLDCDGPCAVLLGQRFAPPTAPLAQGRWLHIWCAWNGERTGRGDPLPGCRHDPRCRLELKAEGGASDIVAPPSIHTKTGRPYVWLVAPDILDTLPALPQLLRYFATPKVVPPAQVERQRPKRRTPDADDVFVRALDRLEDLGGCRYVLESHGHHVRRDGSVLCPMHRDERTPSMKVFPTRDGRSRAYCHTCGYSDRAVGLEAALSGRRAYDVARDHASDRGWLPGRV